MPDSHGNIKCAQEHFWALTPADMERGISEPSHSLESSWPVRQGGCRLWGEVFPGLIYLPVTGSLGNTSCNQPLRARDSLSVMSICSLSAPCSGDSCTPTFWERTLSSPLSGLVLSPQCFPKTLVNMLPTYPGAFICWRYLLPPLPWPAPVGLEFTTLRLSVTRPGQRPK